MFKSITDSEVIRLLNGGAIGILPTDTVYGIVAVASNQKAVGALYAAKHREGKPGTLIAANITQLQTLGIAEDLLVSGTAFWPGPVSVVLSVKKDLSYLHQGQDSLAVRVTADKKLRKLLEQTGPLLTSSANMPNEPTAKDIQEAEHYFGNSVDFYVDGGTIEGNMPSTVLRLEADGTKTVLRRGAIPIDNKE